ncbi:MAG TPA: hypothetical protein VJU86_01435 [Pyrinomonadaceae bacterium]|nr:hypothetical protein [Pyrinomonadaceae bacterium]
MKRSLISFTCVLAGLLLLGVSTLATLKAGKAATDPDQVARYPYIEPNLEVDIVVNGRPLEEYRARGKSYVEALEGQEYEVRVRNRSSYRVAVALSVDGLNTIDARRTTPWNASKWVVEPYGSISVGGWQMSSQRARKFYFTSERDSYGAKLGQTANLGVISAVVFRERRVMVVPVPVTPPHPRPGYEEDGRRKDAPKSSAGGRDAESSAQARSGDLARAPNDDYAATGIGRSVQNDVRWVNMDLEPRAAGEVTIRYEYYPALVRLGVLPRNYPRVDSLRRRESATGFEDRRFSPEP